MRSCPQEGFSSAISRINAWSLLGRRGRPAVLRLPTPEEAESLAVPTQEGVRLHIHRRVAPSEPLTQSRLHPAGGSIGPSRPDLPLLGRGPTGLPLDSDEIFTDPRRDARTSDRLRRSIAPSNAVFLFRRRSPFGLVRVGVTIALGKCVSVRTRRYKACLSDIEMMPVL